MRSADDLEGDVVIPVRLFHVPGPEAPHPLGRNIAHSFFGTAVARFGMIGDVNLHYGILYGGQELHERCKREGKTFVHVDHGFFWRTNDLFSKKGYFRFAKNSQASRHGSPTPRDKLRFESLVKANIIKMFPLSQPPGGRGKFVLYQPPSAHMRAYWKLPADFDEVQLSSLRNEYPDLPVKIYGKGSGILGEALVDCELFVSFNSAAGFFALEMGVMTESTAPVSWWPHKGLDRADFEEARRTAFAYAAGRTFNFEEMASGEAFYHMLSNGEIP